MSNADPPDPDAGLDPTLPAQVRGSRPLRNTRRDDGAIRPTVPTTPKTRDGGPITGNVTSRGDEPVPFSPVPVGSVSGTDAGGFAKFRFGDELGRGGVGVVRLAHDSELRRDIAIKLLKNPDEPGRVEQFIEEAQITGQLEHPNIIPVHELGRDARGRPWLAMKRVSGDTLNAWIKRQHDRPLTARKLREILGLFARVCDAVAFAHSRRVIHRDIKPDNVLLGEYGEVLLGDWGLARPVGDDAPKDRRMALAATRAVTTSRRDLESSHTVEGQVYGTPAFMPPEQASGDIDRVDERADIFALGAMLYNMLTGVPPYRGPDVTAVVMAAATWRFVPPRRRSPQRAIPRELDAIVMKAMAQDPADRYRRVQDLQADIDAYTGFQPVTACRDSLPQQAIKWVRRHPTAAASLVLTLLFVSMMGGAASFLFAEASRQAQERAELEKRTRELESQRSREEAVRRETEAQNHELRLQERELRLQQLADEGKLRELIEELGGKLRVERDAAIDEFLGRWQRARSSGQSDDQFMRQLPSDEVIELVRNFERLFDAHERYPDQIRVTADDWFMVSLLYQGGLGDLKRADAALTRAIELDPHATGALCNRGAIRMKLGDTKRALDDLDRSIEIDPENSAALAARGNAMRTLGRTRDALADYNRALVADPERVEALAGRGSVLVELGDVDMGMADYARALEIAPGFALIHYNRAVSYHDLGRYQEALADYQQAIRFEPDNARYHFNQGVALRDLGRDNEAAEAYTRALAIDPLYGSALQNRATRYLETGRYAEALEDLNRYVRLEPKDPDGYYNRGLAYEGLERHDEAIIEYTHSIDRGGAGEKVFRHRGNVRFSAGDLEGALDDYTRALLIDPLNVKGLVNRGLVHVKLENMAAAREDFERATRAAPDSPEAWVNYGASWSDDDPQKAIPLIQKGYQLMAPDDPRREKIAEAIRELGGTVPD